MGSKNVDVANLILLDAFIHVAWEWEWDEEMDSNGTDKGHLEEESNQESDHVNPYLDSDSDHGDDDSDVIPYTITFKCVGTTHDNSSQETLAKVSQLLQKDEQVPVNIFPEPTNQYDAKAICFKCQIDGEWKRIGYIVHEILDHVHAALLEKKIVSVTFCWVKYLAIWSKSGPGFYTGINIAKNGEWHPDVGKCRSTR